MNATKDSQDLLMNPKTSLITLATLLIFIGSVDANAADKKRRGPPPAPVVIATVIEQAMAPTRWVPGTAISRHDAQVSAETPGRIISIKDIGSHVSKGDAIAQIDDGTLTIVLTERAANVTQFEARLAFLSKEVARLTRLASNNNAAQTLLEQTIAEKKVVQSELDAASARQQQVKDQIKRSTVRAPFDGVVINHLLHEGEWANDNQAVIRLVNTNTIEIQTYVSLSASPFLKTGDTLLIKKNGEKHTGLIRTIAPAGDPTSFQLDIRLTLDSSNWIAGEMIRVAIPTAKARTVLAIPRDALIIRRKGISVYRVNEEGKADRLNVSTGISNEELIEIKGDIQVGDRLITRGGERLRPGQTVNIIPGNAQ